MRAMMDVAFDAEAHLPAHHATQATFIDELPKLGSQVQLNRPMIGSWYHPLPQFTVN